MWLKRKKAASDHIPKLKDEYEQLLKETLPNVRPLHAASEAPRARRADPGRSTQDTPRKAMSRFHVAWLEG